MMVDDTTAQAAPEADTSTSDPSAAAPDTNDAPDAASAPLPSTAATVGQSKAPPLPGGDVLKVLSAVTGRPVATTIAPSDNPNAQPIPAPSSDPTQDIIDSVKQGLVPHESGGNYSAVNPDTGALGKYQFMDGTRLQYAPGSTRESFAASPQLQEATMDAFTRDNLAKLNAHGYGIANFPPDVVAGLLTAMHLGGPGAGFAIGAALSKPGATPASIAQAGSAQDANHTSTITYFNQGRQAYQNTQLWNNMGPQQTLAPGQTTASGYNGSASVPYPSAGLGQSIAANWSGQAASTNQGRYNVVADEFQNSVNKLAKGSGVAAPDLNIGNQMFGAGLPTDRPFNDLAAKYDAYVDQIKQQNPNYGVPTNLASSSNVFSAAGNTLKSQQQDASALNEHGGIANWIGQQVAATGRWLSDASNSVIAGGVGALASGAPEAGAGIGGVIGGPAGAVVGGLIGAGAATAASTRLAAEASEPRRQEENQQLGLPSGQEEAKANIDAQTEGGAIGGVAGKLVAPIVKPVLAAGWRGISNLVSKIFGGKAPEIAAALPPGPIQDGVNTLGTIADATPGSKDGAVAPEMAHSYAMKMDTVIKQVEAGKPVTTLPPGLTGVAEAMPKDPLEDYHIQALQDLGFSETPKMAEWAQSIRDHIASKGNMTPEEYASTPTPDGPVTQPLEEFERGQRTAQNSINEIYRDRTQASKMSMAELQSRASPYGDTLEEQIQHLTFENARISNKINTNQSNLESLQAGNMDGLTKLPNGYKSDVEFRQKYGLLGTDKETQQAVADRLSDRVTAYQQREAAGETLSDGEAADLATASSDGAILTNKLAHGWAEDRAIKGIQSKMPGDLAYQKDIQDLLGQLKGQVEEKPVSPNVVPPTEEEAMNARLSKLQTDIPDAQAVLSSKMDMADTTLKNIDQRLAYNERQSNAFEMNASGLQAALDEAPEGFQKMGLAQQMFEHKQAMAELARDTEMAQAQSNRIGQNRSQMQADSDALSGADVNAAKSGDLSSVERAEAVLNRMKTEDLIDQNKVALEADSEGNVIKSTTRGQILQSLVDGFNALKCFNDCIGRA